MNNFEEYDKAYYEVIEVLNYIPLADYNKIPKKYIRFMEENCDENGTFVYNIALPFEKQNISETAKNILGMIFRLFIVNQDKKNELNNKDKESQRLKELEKQMRYNPDNLFKRNNKNKKEVKENVALVEEKNSIIKKIWNKIKNIFRR